MPPRRRFSSGKRRQTTWVGPADQNYVAVATGAKTILASFDPAAAGLVKPTIVRNRGLLFVRPQVVTASLTLAGAWGIGVVTDRAFAAGAASIPGPFTDADWDGWMAWGSWLQHWLVVSQIGSLYDSIEMPIESKGMRKIADDETLVFMIESQSGAASVGMLCRTLFKLS